MYEALLEPIDKRRSNRAYIDRPIEEETKKRLNELLAIGNKDGSLNLQLNIAAPEAFFDMKKTYGAFSGVQNYISIVGNTSEPDMLEKVGYFGERFVLEATAMGLATCWITLTYDSEHTKAQYAEGEELIGVIPIGYAKETYSEKEQEIYTRIGARKKKPITEFFTSDNTPPQWFLDGMKAVSTAPSGANAMPVYITYEDGRVTATIKGKAYTPEIDLGIAKFHFTVGAGGGTWAWGKNSQYTRD